MVESTPTAYEELPFPEGDTKRLTRSQTKSKVKSGASPLRVKLVPQLSITKPDNQIHRTLQVHSNLNRNSHSNHQNQAQSLHTFMKITHNTFNQSSENYTRDQDHSP